MDFVQTKNKKLRKVWRAGDYRITVNRRPFGVRVPLHYYACVSTPTGWDFAAHRRPYKTLEAAIKACETSRRFWEQFRELSEESGGRLRRLEDLIDKAKRQRVYLAVTLPTSISKECDKRLLEMLNPKPRTKVEDDDDCGPTATTTVTTAEPPSCEETSVPAPMLTAPPAPVEQVVSKRKSKTAASAGATVKSRPTKPRRGKNAKRKSKA